MHCPWGSDLTQSQRSSAADTRLSTSHRHRRVATVLASALSGDEALRSDYLGRTKCFCWWRATLKSGSWEINGFHGALEHWSRCTLTIHALVSYASEWGEMSHLWKFLCHLVFFPRPVWFVLTGLAQTWLIISRFKVWAPGCVSARQKRDKQSFLPRPLSLIHALQTSPFFNSLFGSCVSWGKKLVF